MYSFSQPTTSVWLLYASSFKVGQVAVSLPSPTLAPGSTFWFVPVLLPAIVEGELNQKWRIAALPQLGGDRHDVDEDDEAEAVKITDKHDSLLCTGKKTGQR
ncbi:hypothetical protein NQ176_g4687 [Zarea fungicola]|uniref:Uncharacterized protein n=1 Tax=Zarea fungicola TaxID=93591 RepID=A0ACC1NCV1_9HYPO|nr:hypothetical protein NQ176_g4687 [Lecanicillium fungicola]